MEHELHIRAEYQGYGEAKYDGEDLCNTLNQKVALSDEPNWEVPTPYLQFIQGCFL